MKHSQFPIKDYKGTHWTQKPENKKRLSEQLKKAHKAKSFQALAAKGVRQAKQAKSVKPVKKTKPFSLVVNGYRITLGKDELKIESE